MRDCCSDDTNRSDPQPTDKPELMFTVCHECGAKHYVLSIDPITVGATGENLG